MGQIAFKQSTTNRLITTKQYDNLNRLSSIGSVPSAGSPLVYGYQYTDGNQTVGGRWNYTWDAENRLVRMVANTAVGPQQRIDYGYDAKGRRISKKVWSNTAGTGSPATYNRFIYDGWNLLAELDGNNTNAIVRSYIWGSDLSGSMHGAGGVGGLLMINDPTTVATHFVAYDGNGNVAATVSGSAVTTTATYEYGPFGEVIRSSGTISKTNPYRFSTKYQDNETDLLYYGYRFYNQTTGRWLSRDPIHDTGFTSVTSLLPKRTKDRAEILVDFSHPGNQYEFLKQDAIRRADILGLGWWDVYKCTRAVNAWQKKCNDEMPNCDDVYWDD